MTRSEYEMIRRIAKATVKFGDWEDVAQMASITISSARRRGKIDGITRGLVRRVVRNCQSDLDRKEKGQIKSTHERKFKAAISFEQLMEVPDELRWGGVFKEITAKMIAPITAEPRVSALEALQRLSERERTVAEARWLGWIDDEIAEVIGVTPARVCQIRRGIREEMIA